MDFKHISGSHSDKRLIQVDHPRDDSRRSVEIFDDKAKDR